MIYQYVYQAKELRCVSRLRFEMTRSSTITLLLFLVLSSCSSEPELENINSASWSKALAFTECSQDALTGTPFCKASINALKNDAHTHIIETDKQSIKIGELININFFRGETKDTSDLRTETYPIVEIVKEGDMCRLFINPIKYQDVFLVVGECKSND